MISGTWYVGWGDRFDETRLTALPAGSFYTEPADIPHYVTTKNEAVGEQITGIGPTGLPYTGTGPAPAR